MQKKIKSQPCRGQTAHASAQDQNMATGPIETLGGVRKASSKGRKANRGKKVCTQALSSGLISRNRPRRPTRGLPGPYHRSQSPCQVLPVAPGAKADAKRLAVRRQQTKGNTPRKKTGF